MNATHITYLPRGPRKRDKQDTVFYARKHNTGFQRPPLKQPQWVYDPDQGELTDGDKQFWSAVVFVHQETSGDWYGIQGEPGWSNAWSRTLVECYWQYECEDLPTTKVTDDLLPFMDMDAIRQGTLEKYRQRLPFMFLNQLGFLTKQGRQWNQESWKKFRQRYGQKLQSFFNWICELRDNQERTLPTPKTNASVIYKGMKSVEGVLAKDQRQELDYLIAAANGYEGSQRKGRPRKQISKNEEGILEKTFGDTVNATKIRNQLVAGMKAMNMKPNKQLLEMLEGGVGR